jgi:DNA-binding transcriptional ArsR family regulator
VPRAATTSDPFNAIAEPRRRDILALLADEEHAVNDIAEVLQLGQPSVSKHLRVLLDVGLVRVRRDGRQAYYRTDSARIKAVHDWTRQFERHWQHQLQRIKERAELSASNASPRPPHTGESA